jgi:4-amino-4-deoxy-L-arabinose transferase-like glycosyltransferase
MRHIRLGWGVLVLLLAAAARFYQLPSQSIWFDEGWSAFAAIQPNVFAAAAADSTNPPLYYMSLNLAVRYLGENELALRWVSSAFGFIGIALGMQFARQCWGERACIAAGLLLALNPLLWWAAQEARMYTLLALLVTLAALGWQRWITRWRWQALLLILLAELALLYSHNTGPVIVLWLNAVTFLAFTLSALRGKRPPRNVLIHWFIGQSIVGVLWWPYFQARFLLLQEANSAITAVTAIHPADVWQALWAGSWRVVTLRAEPLLPILTLLLFILILLIIPWRSSPARWLILHTLLLLGGLWLGLTVLGNDLHGRYLVMIAPLPLIALSGAALQSGGLWKTLGLRVLLIATALTFMLAVHWNTTNPAYQHDDARGMVAHYAQTLTAADSVVMWSYADRYELAYYWDRLGVQAERITLPEGADLDAITPLLPTDGNVARNIWFTQRADFRGMLGCVLADGTRQPPQLTAVYGMHSETYIQPTLNLPYRVDPLTIQVGGLAQITGIRALPAYTPQQALCVPIQMTLTQPMPVDLKAVLSLMDSNGQEVARADAVFADRIQRLTSQLTPGAAVTAYPVLRPLYGTAPGTYRLHLRVYDEVQAISGYALSSVAEPQIRLEQVVGVVELLPGGTWSDMALREVPAVPVDAVVEPTLRLLGHDAQGGTLRNGDSLQVQLLWEGTGDLLDLHLRGADWDVTLPAPQSPRDDAFREWRSVQVPLEATAGEARLLLGETVLAVYTIENIPLLTTAPEVAVPIQQAVGTVGTVIGYTLDNAPLDPAQPITITLVWRAEAASSQAYTVFVQLVTPDGQVLAQSDSQPAVGSRPTTGWRMGEYIVDQHSLRWNVSALPESTQLIAGLYDAQTFERVGVAGGEDYVLLGTLP